MTDNIAKSDKISNEDKNTGNIKGHMKKIDIAKHLDTTDMIILIDIILNAENDKDKPSVPDPDPMTGNNALHNAMIDMAQRDGPEARINKPETTDGEDKKEGRTIDSMQGNSLFIL